MSSSGRFVDSLPFAVEMIMQRFVAIFKAGLLSILFYFSFHTITLSEALIQGWHCLGLCREASVAAFSETLH